MKLRSFSFDHDKFCTRGTQCECFLSQMTNKTKKGNNNANIAI